MASGSTERADVQTIREAIGGCLALHGYRDDCPACVAYAHAHAALDSLADALRTAEEAWRKAYARQQEWMRIAKDERARAVTAEKERDGAIAALDRETRALYDEIERYRAALRTAKDAKFYAYQDARAALASSKPSVRNGECGALSRLDAVADEGEAASVYGRGCASGRAAHAQDRAEAESLSELALRTFGRVRACDTADKNEFQAGFLAGLAHAAAKGDIATLVPARAALAAASTEGADG